MPHARGRRGVATGGGGRVGGGGLAPRMGARSERVRRGTRLERGPERRRRRPPGVHPLLRRPCRPGILESARARRGHRCRGVHRRLTCRHRQDRPPGYLLELQAVHLVEAILPPLGFDHRAEALYEVLLLMARAGFTSGQVQDLAPDTIELLQTIEATRDLPIRLRMSPWYVPGAPLEEVARLAALQGVHGRRWMVEGVKLMIDGTVDNGTAWLHEPDCLGESTTSLWLEPEQYREALIELDQRGIPTTTHAIGDAGIDFVVR